MLGTLRTRPAAAAACLVAATMAAAPLTAQVRVAAGDAVAPTLLSDCDITVQSCGIEGGELYGGGGYDGGTNVSGTTAQCGSGWKVVCETKAAETCTKWVIVEGSGTVKFSITGAAAGGSITQVCAEYVTNTLTFYMYA